MKPASTARRRSSRRCSTNMPMRRRRSIRAGLGFWRTRDPRTGAATPASRRTAAVDASAIPQPRCALDAWLCDLKEMRIGDGLHVFGRAPSSAPSATTRSQASTERPPTGPDAVAALSRRLRRRRDRRAARRRSTGASCAPGPGRRALARPRSTCCRRAATSTPSIRAPSRRARPGRSARARPTRSSTATRRTMATGRARIVLDLWGTATMRTGGDDLAQAMALLGVQADWDAARPASRASRSCLCASSAGRAST